ncbi:hypothetical protein LX36DRAFT_351908 [Colletotrichum falcatum]|nr:hypothetical protein LX36DRAFT_351908 [Colletotrichum falcatum]
MKGSRISRFGQNKSAFDKCQGLRERRPPPPPSNPPSKIGWGGKVPSLGQRRARLGNQRATTAAAISFDSNPRVLCRRQPALLIPQERSERGWEGGGGGGGENPPPRRIYPT